MEDAFEWLDDDVDLSESLSEMIDEAKGITDAHSINHFLSVSHPVRERGSLPDAFINAGVSVMMMRSLVESRSLYEGFLAKALRGLVFLSFLVPDEVSDIQDEWFAGAYPGVLMPKDDAYTNILSALMVMPSPPSMPVEVVLKLEGFLRSLARSVTGSIDDITTTEMAEMCFSLLCTGSLREGP